MFQARAITIPQRGAAPEPWPDGRGHSQEVVVRLVALCSWFDEDPRWLRNMVLSLPRLGVDHLVALDGSYAQWPLARVRSSALEHSALRVACESVGIGHTIEASRTDPWQTEMEKRTHLFRMGDEQQADWFLVIDADTVVLHAQDVKRKLDGLEVDAAVSQFVEPHPDATHKQFEIRNFFRAIPGITVETNHYTYVTPDGRKLWGRHPCEPAVEVPVMFEHRSFLRPAKRFRASRTYYRVRDESAIEAGVCEICGERADLELPTDWRLKGVEGGKVQLTSSWMSVCRPHEREVRERNERTLRERYGLDPRTVQVTFEKAGAA